MGFENSLLPSHRKFKTGLSCADLLAGRGLWPGLSDFGYWTNGVLFIESPNRVTFRHNMALNGILVADGDVINRAHQVVNNQAARENRNEEITSQQEKDHGKEAK